MLIASCTLAWFGLEPERLSSINSDLFVQAWTNKSELMLDSLSGSRPNQAKVQLAMRIRMRDHIDHWKQKKNQLETLVKDSNQEPQSLFERLLTLVRRAGVHSHHIQEP